jgi:predicted ATPase
VIDRLPGLVVFVDLTEAESVMEIATATANALGLSLERMNESDPVKLVAQSLRETAGLVILDNFEQATPFAQETVGHWSESAPEVQFLVTSRAPLHLDGEKIYRLDSLPEPHVSKGAEPLDINENPAVQLFADRVRKYHPQFELNSVELMDVVEICRRVECLPLLLEIAASRVKTHKLPRLVEDLRREDWLRTLESPERPFRKKEGGAALRTFAWSYQFLSAAAQAVFAQTCVFRGGFDETAGRAILEVPAGLPLSAILEELVDHCFLKFDADTERFYPYAQSLQEFGRRFWTPSSAVPPP